MQGRKPAPTPVHRLQNGGCGNFLSSSKKIAGRGGGGSIADITIHLCGVFAATSVAFYRSHAWLRGSMCTVFQHPVVDGAQRIADDPLPLPAKVTTFESIIKVFHEDGCRFAILQER